MRIAILTDYAYPLIGGISEHVAGEADAMVARGHAVTIVTGTPLVVPRIRPDERPAPLEERHDVVRLGTALPAYGNGTGAVITWVPGLRRRLASLLHARGIDVVHTHAPYNPSMPLYAIRTAIDIPVVGTFHSVFARNMVQRSFWRTVRPAIARLDRRLAVSRSCAAELAEIFGMSFSVVPNGVDPDRFHPRADRSSPPNIVWVGRFDTRTGLRAVADAIRTAGRRDVQLVLVGDGPLRRTHQLTLGRHLPGRVHFALRRHRTLPEILARSTAVCCTSRRASFGMTVLEAMACGRPVIASRTAGHSELVAEGTTGLLVGLDNVDEIAEAVDDLVTDERRASLLGMAGRDRALGKFAWPAVAHTLERVFLDTLRGQAPEVEVVRT